MDLNFKEKNNYAIYLFLTTLLIQNFFQYV